MQRSCDRCGKPYEAKRSTSRYCGVNCRTAVSRAGGVPRVVAAPPVVISPVSSESPEQSEQSDILPPLVVAVIQELNSAGRLNSVKGQLTLGLALNLVSAGVFDNLSQRASATREVRASLDAALAGAKPSADALDELERRRREKAASA